MVYFRPLHFDPINSGVSLTSDGFRVLLLLSWHFARIGQLLSRDDALGLPWEWVRVPLFFSWCAICTGGSVLLAPHRKIISFLSSLIFFPFLIPLVVNQGLICHTLTTPTILQPCTWFFWSGHIACMGALKDAFFFFFFHLPPSHPIPSIYLCYTNPLQVLLHYILSLTCTCPNQYRNSPNHSSLQVSLPSCKPFTLTLVSTRFTPRTLSPLPSPFFGWLTSGI